MNKQYLITKYLSEENYRAWRVEEWNIVHNRIEFKNREGKEVILSFDNVSVEEI